MTKYRKGGFRPNRHYYWWLQDGICAYCKEWTAPAQFTIDHIQPISRGGSKNDPRNIVGACESCNFAKADDWPSPELLLKVMKRNGWMPTHPVAWDVPWLAERLGVNPLNAVGYR